MMNAIDVCELKQGITWAARKFKCERGSLPASMTVDDLVQEGMLLALERMDTFIDDGRASYSTYIKSIVRFRWIDYIAKQYFGPSAQVRHYTNRKAGFAYYSEVSIECTTDGKWQEWLNGLEDGSDGQVSFIELSEEESACCIKELELAIEANDDAGISFSKTRNKYHVQVKACKCKQFIGQFKLLESARKAKRDFLVSFLSVVRDTTAISVCSNSEGLPC